MNLKMLPIGSVIRVYDNNDDIMICAYIKKGRLINDIQYDYACCLYPFGLEENAILIKRDDIEKVLFIGYQNGNFQELKKYIDGEINV